MSDEQFDQRDQEHFKDMQRLINKHRIGIKRLQDEIAYLENRLKSEFDAGYKLGVKEGMNEIEKLKKLLQAFKPN
jgi:hypothetical protein